MTPDQYASLLDEVATAYGKSRIADTNPNWYYGVVATTITPGSPLIVGINWGVDPRAEHKPPTAAEYNNLRSLPEQMKIAGELGSLVRLKPYLERHVPNWEQAGQANLYFFRTRVERELCEEDRTLCEPIFQHLLTIARPSLIIALAASVRDWFLRCDGLLKSVERETIIDRGGPRSVKIVRGRFELDGTEGRFVSVPHPAARLPADVRNRAWEAAFA